MWFPNFRYPEISLSLHNTMRFRKWKKEREILLIHLSFLPVHPSLPDSGPVSLPTHLPNSYLPKEPPPRATESLSSMTLPLRGPLGNSSGSPHLGNMMHPPMPPSCIMEELQRAFASKNRQERWVLRLTSYICLCKRPDSDIRGLRQTNMSLCLLSCWC